ncbi:MAG: hypothetical protein EOP19_19905 [Hyphomicrobiales bacterium]|nr:MAG: hypothetical protein EOP19_19905 [Hyphomicrobiales bacterium]
MTDEEWLDPFLDALRHKADAVFEAPFHPVPGLSFDATPAGRTGVNVDPEPALMAPFAAHAEATCEAAASARQRQASRMIAWRQGRALDGHPVT